MSAHAVAFLLESEIRLAFHGIEFGGTQWGESAPHEKLPDQRRSVEFSPLDLAHLLVNLARTLKLSRQFCLESFPTGITAVGAIDAGGFGYVQSLGSEIVYAIFS
jgi:hypothetical protein